MEVCKAEEDEEVRMNIIKQILAREWDFFQEAQHTEGRAECQDNPEEFKIMRSSQWEVFPLNILRSYLDDLIIAGHRKRNLVVEKYARMMEYSVPEEYERISGFLPPLEEGKKEKVEEIVKIYMEWEREAEKKYPELLKRGRPLTSEGDTPNHTSVETYLKGELLSYSIKTLKLYYEYVRECQVQKINLAERNIGNIVRKKGYSSLEGAEMSLVGI